MKLIFMGTPDFALPTLKALHTSPHQIAAVYTQPPRPAGRGQKEKPSPVHAYATEKNLPVYTPASLKIEDEQRRFRAHEADVAIVVAYGLLLPQSILEGTRLGCINVHPSLLPRWRGAAPIQRAIIAGDTQTGIVIMQMDKGLDTGDMLRVEPFAIPADTNAGQLHDRLADMAGPLVLETLGALAKGTASPIKQPESGITYAQKITREECRIDWHEPAHVISNKIRGLSPQPGAFFMHEGEAIKIFRAEIISSHVSSAPGTVIDNNLTIACGEGALRLLEVQRPGKKPMSAETMLQGYSIPAGTELK